MRSRRVASVRKPTSPDLEIERLRYRRGEITSPACRERTSAASRLRDLRHADSVHFRVRVAADDDSQSADPTRQKNIPGRSPGGVIVHARARLESKAHAGRANSMESIGWSELRRAKTRNDVARRQRYFARPRPDRQKQRRAGLDELRSRTFYPSFQELVQLRGGSVVEPPFALLQEQVEMLAGDPVIPPQVPRGLAPEILNLVDPRAASHQAP